MFDTIFYFKNEEGHPEAIGQEKQEGILDSLS